MNKVKYQQRNSKYDTIMVISTFGRDQLLTSVTKKIEKQSDTLKFRYVKKTGPSLSPQKCSGEVKSLRLRPTIW